MSKETLTKSTLTIMACTLLGALTGFFAQILTAKYFGASKELDAFVTASIVPFIFFGFASNSFMTALIYVLTKNKIDINKNKLNNVSSALINISIILMFLICTILFFISPIIAKILAPGFDIEQLKLTSNLIKILLLFLFFFGVSTITTGLLYLKNHFITPALMRAFLGFGAIISLIILQNKYSVYCLAIGSIIGSGIAVSAQVIALILQQFRYTLKISLNKTIIKDLLKNSWLIWITTIFYYLNKSINNTFASFLTEGSVSILNYAFLLTVFPANLIAGAIATAIYPQLTKNSALMQKKQCKEILTKSIRYTLFLLLPIMFIIIILREEIIIFLLQRGKFDAIATSRTAITLAYYATGLCALGLYLIIINTLIGFGEIKKSVWLTAGLLGINTLLNFILLKYSTPGLALAVSISYWVCCVIGIMMIKRKIQNLNTKNLIKSAIKITLACVPAFLFLFLITESIKNMYVLIPALLISCVIYLVFCKILKIKEIELIKEKLKKFLSIKKIEKNIWRFDDLCFDKNSEYYVSINKIKKIATIFNKNNQYANFAYIVRKEDTISKEAKNCINFLLKQRHQIIAHGAPHVNWKNLTEKKIQNAVIDMRQNLNTMGIQTNTFLFPGLKANHKAYKWLKKYGFNIIIKGTRLKGLTHVLDKYSEWKFTLTFFTTNCTADITSNSITVINPIYRIFDSKKKFTQIMDHLYLYKNQPNKEIEKFILKHMKNKKFTTFQKIIYFS